ncbi:MAG: hypothetical protein A2Y61_06725 [Chloroflexi bacterium RBG_13_60_13]|nr:MAG: hypothetical protein A2Y61_06725 [Chloroflexi bacterium RBG_13_60_13]HXK36325.1 response regulator [Candidatus Paceibacterota bacterium]
MKKVLVVDDEQSIVVYLTTLLEDTGYETCSAVDGPAGRGFYSSAVGRARLSMRDLGPGEGVKAWREAPRDAAAAPGGWSAGLGSYKTA